MLGIIVLKIHCIENHVWFKATDTCIQSQKKTLLCVAVRIVHAVIVEHKTAVSED
jgi:hypothetical protein